MTDCKHTLFSIGQFAALHEINKKTLMWYDETGIFKPAAVGENGYRYYTYYQSAALETILMLRKMNVSIREIRRFMEERSALGLKALLEEKLAALDADIRHLERIRNSLSRKKDEMTMLLDLDLSEMAVVECEEQYLATVPAMEGTLMEKEIELVIAEARRQQLSSLHDTVYGSMLPVESLYAGRFEEYSMLFMEVRKPGKAGKEGEAKVPGSAGGPEMLASAAKAIASTSAGAPGRLEDTEAPAAWENLHRKPEGRYLRAYCRGEWERLPSKYQEILAYAKNQRLVLTGYAYETGINEIVADTMDEYITQIEIRVEG